MYKAGASLSSIMAITGHSSEQQLKTYLKLDEDEELLEEELLDEEELELLLGLGSRCV